MASLLPGPPMPVWLFFPPLHSVGKVNITLRDINDNRPVFYPVQYFANVKENEPSGSFVTTVSATDPDLGRNGTLKYIITAGDSSKFRINSNTGKISTLVPLDREEKTAYQLQVTAADGGGLRSHIQAIVTVTVIDTQDNPPVFSQRVYTPTRSRLSRQTWGSPSTPPALSSLSAFTTSTTTRRCSTSFHTRSLSWSLNLSTVAFSKWRPLTKTLV
uniref:Cadherin domain-containing protein n=1 Tax=Labrus bergylta TaxID=56723 RepID=A0A3Q3F211_9LABR